MPLIAKIAIAMTFINAWVIFEETIVDRHGLWRYMPYYRVGLFYFGQAARSFAAISLYSGSGNSLLGAGDPGAFPPKDGTT